MRSVCVAVLSTAASATCHASDLSVGDSCKETWRKLQPVLRPTQEAVGYAMVLYKHEKNFATFKKSQTEMTASPIPVVKRGNVLYVVDHHHTLSALDRSGFDVDVTIKVVCDYSKELEHTFWSSMARDGFAYLSGRPAGSLTVLPTPIDPDSLPTSFRFDATAGSDFADDPWRSLAGYTRKIKADDGTKSARCFLRDCAPDGGTINYFEYRWAYYFDAAYLDAGLWDDPLTFRAFKKTFEKLAPTHPNSTGVPARWQEACATLLPLCRGSSAGSFMVPLQEIAGHLPGYHSGSGPISPGKDPTCDTPSKCPDILAGNTTLP